MLDDFHYTSGRYEPTLDVIAADDFKIARRIASLSPRNWRRECEHEGDYCYANILFALTEDRSADEAFLQLLNRLGAYNDDALKVRYAVCQALMQRNQGQFDEAFDALLNEQAVRAGGHRHWDSAAFAAIKKMHGRDTDEVELETLVHGVKLQVFIEGLAILRLAEARGLRTGLDYPYCPTLARGRIENLIGS
jgi:hypothetical protein